MVLSAPAKGASDLGGGYGNESDKAELQSEVSRGSRLGQS